MEKEKRSPWRLAVGVLGGVLTAAGVVLMVLQRNRPAPAEMPVAEPEIEEAPLQDRIIAVLSVDDSGLPDAVPQFKAELSLGSASRFPIRHVCMSWNAGQDRDCAHVEHLVTESSVLSRTNPSVTYVFDRLAPSMLENAIGAADLALEVHPQGEDVPIQLVQRRALRRSLQEWLTAMDAYYAAHDYDRVSTLPESPSKAA